MPIRDFVYWNTTEEDFTDQDPTQDSLRLPALDMQGDVTMNWNKITTLGAASASGDAIAYQQSGAELDGLTVTDDIAMSGNEVTGLPSSPSVGSAATSKTYVDNLVSNISWKEPVMVRKMVDDSRDQPPPVYNTGDAFVVGSSPAGAWSGFDTGDIVEWDGSQWNEVVPGVGSEPPDNTRVIVTTAAASGSFAGHENDIGTYDADGDSWSFEDPSDGWAVLVNGDGSIYEHLGYVYDTTSYWVQFNGAGQITAGDGLSKDGNTIDVNFGDGIYNDGDYVTADLYSNGGLAFTSAAAHAAEIEINLATSNPGLEISGNELDIKYDGAHGIITGSSGVEIEIDTSPDTLTVTSSGLAVTGLPLNFKVNDVATGSTVTAPNFDTLTDGSNADALHTHGGATESERNEYDFTAAATLAAGDPVYFDTTDNQVAEADAGAKATARVVGVARTAITGSTTGPIVFTGRSAGSINGLGFTAGDRLWLANGGGLTSTVPGVGNRRVQVGYAITATDILVQIQYFGLV